MTAKVGWGIIGCGSFCRRRILPAFPAVGNARVVAAQRRQQADAEATAKEFNVPKAYASRAELLADPDIQAVFIGSHNAGHLEDVEAACLAKKHVLCEKPLGLNAAECREMIASARKAGVKLFTGHCGRYTQALQTARRMIAAGELGTIACLRSVYCVRGKEGTWRLDSREAGGGPLLDLGPHALDLLRYISGDEVVSLNAVTEPLRDFKTGQSELIAKAFLRFSKGTLGTVELSYREPFRNGFEVSGTGGALRGDYNLSLIQNENIKLVKITSDPNPPLFETLPYERREIYQLQLEDVSRAILDPNHQPICATGEDGLKTLQIIDAIYESGAQRGTEVRVG